MVQDTLNHQEEAKEKQWGISLCVASPLLHLLCQEAITVSGCSSFYQAEEIMIKNKRCHDGEVSTGMRLCPAVFAGSIYTATSRLV